MTFRLSSRARRRIRAARALAFVITGGPAPCAPAQKSTGVLAGFDWRRAAAVQVRLPRGLQEISGLAVTGDGRVLTHGDERGVISELDPKTGRVTKSFTLGAPAIRGDFEGIAVVGERIFMITSGGMLFETREGADGTAMRYTAYDTGLGALCELEGLAYEPSDRTLIIGCKEPYDRALRGSVALFRWSLEGRRAGTPASLSMPVSGMVRGTGAKAFRTSAVEREPRSGHYVIVAGPQRLIAEVTPEGAIVGTRELMRGLHRQPEGITFFGDSAVIIADEGGTGPGALTSYPRAR